MSSSLVAAPLTHHEQAETLLHFVERIEGSEVRSPTDEEKARYDSLLSVYLDTLGKGIEKMSEEWIARFAGQQLTPPGDLFLATAYLNKKEYTPFFEHFAKGYPPFSESYLSLRAQGILCLHVAALLNTPQQVQYFKERGVDFLSRSLQVCAVDFSVYEILVTHAKEEENDLLLGMTLESLVDSKSTIPRRSVYLLVREAIRLERVEIAQKIIDRAKELYEYCRATAAAEQYMREYRKSCSQTAQKGEL